MSYTPINWRNTPSTSTPINQTNLNKMDSKIADLDENKVDKVSGKGLSTNDYTTEEKNKLSGISANAKNVSIMQVVTEGTTLANITIDGTTTAIKGSDIDVDDELSTVSENPVQNKVITNAFVEMSKQKADKNGEITSAKTSYSLLCDTPVNDNEPYTYRQLPVANGKLEKMKKIVGASVVWNQLVDTNTTNVTITSGHKYIHWNGSTLTKATSDGTAISVVGGTDKISDLTAMFGSTVADGITAEKFAFLFPNYSATAYSANTIQSVSVSGHKVVGFNQWDEEYEEGMYNTTTGAKQVGTNRIRSKNYIKVLANTEYYCKSPIAASAIFFDSNMAIIEKISGNNNYIPIQNRTFTTMSNACYMAFYTSTDAQGQYNNNICINISDANRNGEYQPYSASEESLDHTTLRGLFKLDANNNLYADGDIYNADGSGSGNWAEIDLGEQTYTIGTTSVSGKNRWSFTRGNIRRTSALAEKAEIVCEKYQGVTGVQTYNATETGISISNNSNQIFIYDPDLNDMTAEQVKTALSGVKLIYPIATPTTATLTPFNELSALEQGGTEESIDYGVEQGNRDVAIPCGTDTDFYQGLSLPTLPTSGGKVELTYDPTNGVFSWE